MKKIIVILVLILAIVAVLYYFGPYQKQQEEEIPQETSEVEKLDLANPAAVYCQTQGGALEIFAFESGDDAYCVFDDGSVCWEWDFFEGRCNKGQLQINILEEGTGRPSGKGDTVLVHYRGFLSDGTQFDSSFDKGEPIWFVLGPDSILEQGVLGMKEGEKRELIVGQELDDADEALSRDTVLFFEVELLEISAE